MQIAALGVGLLLLVLGRKLVWLGVAGLGFFFGMACAGAFFVEQSTGVVLLMGLAGGLLGALLAVLAQRAAFAFAGFYAGSYLALLAASAVGVGGQRTLWFVAGGILGAVLAAWLVDWALIALTSAVGASAIVGAGSMGPTTAALSVVGLTAVGVVVQARLMGPRRAERHRKVR
jgi:hypothetical protein